MANRHSAGAVVLVLALVGPALAGAPEPIRMALHPAAAPTPALRYHLLPQLYEMTPGNAAERYKQAIEAAQKVRKAGSPEGEIKTWLELLPAELPRAKARKLLGRYQEVFRLADRAARCETCDWGFAERLRQKGITADVPEIQDMRLITNLLALRARLNVVEGHIEPALRALQTGFAAAKHVGEADTLIGSLAGIAVGESMTRELGWLVCQPQAPNLYWALTDLPRPFLDLRRPLQAERLAAYGTFPGLLEVARDWEAGALSPAQIKTGVGRFFKYIVEMDTPDARTHMALKIRARHAAAKEALIAEGRPRERVEKWPHAQVALLHAMRRFDRFLDELLKWQSFPYWEAREGLARAGRQQREARVEQLFPKGDTPALPVAVMIVPGINRLFPSRAALDRKIAALRCVEAIRLYAAAHGGRLPQALAEVKEVPVPADPMTGKPFPYRLDGNKATLHAPPLDGDVPSNHTFTCELTLKH